MTRTIDWKRQARLLLAGAVLGTVALAALPADAATAKCKTPNVAHEPPCNPALPNSPWGTSHRGSYAQGSAAKPGLLPGHKVRTKHIQLPGIPIVLEFSDRYRDGGRAVWGSLISAVDERAVFKVDHETGKLVDLYIPSEREPNPPPVLAGGISGAYNILDADGRFIVPRQRSIDVYADSKEGKAGSRKRRFAPIRLAKRFFPPESTFCRADDRFVGATMTYDGRIAFVTEQGMVGTIPRKPAKMTAENIRVISINGSRCADSSVSADELEQISNNIAVDEKGGIYIVTSDRMRKVRWMQDSRELQMRWSAPYESERGTGGIRLGEGSGATPSLMGTGKQRDRLVVISEGSPVMKTAMFWRDGIPKGWKGLGGDVDRRLACSKSIRFGDPDLTASASEQSVLVRGYAAIAVQNLLQDESVVAGAPGIFQSALAALYGGDPALAPHGVERVDWKPGKQRCQRRWSSNASIPNSVPTMSQATNLFYAVGQREGKWGVRALDFDSGRSRFFARAPSAPCDQSVFTDLPEIAKPFILPVLEQLPNSCENSLFAATEVGPNKTIYTGTFAGMTVYRTGKPR